MKTKKIQCSLRVGRELLRSEQTVKVTAVTDKDEKEMNLHVRNMAKQKD